MGAGIVYVQWWVANHADDGGHRLREGENADEGALAQAVARVLAASADDEGACNGRNRLDSRGRQPRIGQAVTLGPCDGTNDHGSDAANEEQPGADERTEP